MEAAHLLTLGFVFIATIAYALYRSVAKYNEFWRMAGIPCPPPVPIFGSLGPMFYKPMHEVELDSYSKYKPVFGGQEGNIMTLTVSDLDLLKNILVKDFQYFTDHRDFEIGNRITDNMVLMLKGEKWKRVRTLITPTFTTGKIKKMANLINDSVQSLSNEFLSFSKSGEPVDVKKRFGAFSMDVIAICAFSTKLDSHSDPDNPFATMARVFFNTNITWRTVLFLFFTKLTKFFHISIFSPKALKFFEDVVLQIIKERRRTKGVHNDFLQLMLDAADEPSKLLSDNEVESEDNGDTLESASNETENSYKSLTRDEIVAQCVIFFIAGYETTSNTLSFAAYMLALNPDCQEKLIAEIDTTAEENEGQLTYDAIMGMKYLEKVTSETLRLFPPLIRLERRAVQDYKLTKYDFTVKEGMVIAVPVFAMQRDPEMFPDPEKFDPERFTQEQKEARNQYTYMPFGAGPRVCIGKRFAMAEMKLCLAHLLRQYRFKPCSKTKVPLDFYKGQQILQPKEVVLTVERRQDVETH